jgi:uncharacterized protein with HEPN domain
MWRDDAYLLDMLTAARDACAFASRRSRADFDASRMTQYAVAHALQTIGEAAAHVSEEMRVQITDIAWANIVGMRNRLVHDYGRIDRDVFWGIRCRRIFPR